MRHSGFQMSFDGYDFSDLLTVERVHRPRAAEIRNETSDVAGRDGALWRSQHLGSRTIEVDVRIIARKSGKKNQARALDGLEDRIIARLLKPDLCKLVLRDRPDRFDLAAIDGAVDFEAEGNTRAATLSFLCPHPASYGDWKERESTGGGVEMLVDGSFRTYPTIMVEATGPFSVAIDGVMFEVIGEDSGTIIIDCENHATTHDGIVVPVSIESDYPAWEPGVVHSVECDLPYRVGFYERWL